MINQGIVRSDQRAFKILKIGASNRKRLYEYVRLELGLPEGYTLATIPKDTSFHFPKVWMDDKGRLIIEVRRRIGPETGGA